MEYEHKATDVAHTCDEHADAGLFVVVLILSIIFAVVRTCA